MEPSTAKESARRETRDPVARAFAILLWMVDASGTAWGLREIAAGVAMHPSTLYRVLSHLQEGGQIQQDPETGRYSLGLGFLRLAWKAADHHSVREIALPWLKALVDATGETALLALYDPSRQEMLLAATVDSPHPIRQMRQIAEWLPVTAGATGLAILAFLPEAEQHAILTRPLPALTPHTTTNRPALERALARIRQQGYALTHGERTPGAAGVAAPIVGPAGRVIGSVGITQPEQRFRPEDAPHQAERVISSARIISDQLSGSAYDTAC
ncbi:MAG: IclR family transcriptional regulator [Thermomicrobia bacterium]|nr:IclR family transcriptional regulator [Thermomicrobia bacterium]